MAYYSRYVKLQKYYLGQPVEPAIYKKGDYITTDDFDTLDDCLYDYIWIPTDKTICVNSGGVITKYVSLQAYINPDTPVEPAIYKPGDVIATNCTQEDCPGPRERTILDLDEGTLTTSKSDDCGNTWVVVSTKVYEMHTDCSGCQIMKYEKDPVSGSSYSAFNTYPGRSQLFLSDDGNHIYFGGVKRHRIRSSTYETWYELVEIFPDGTHNLIAKTDSLRADDNPDSNYQGFSSWEYPYYDTSSNRVYFGEITTTRVNISDTPQITTVWGIRQTFRIYYWDLSLSETHYVAECTITYDSVIPSTSYAYMPHGYLWFRPDSVVALYSINGMVLISNWDYEGNLICKYEHFYSESSTPNTNTHAIYFGFNLKDKIIEWCDTYAHYKIPFPTASTNEIIVEQEPNIQYIQDGSLVSKKSMWNGMWYYNITPYYDNLNIGDTNIYKCDVTTESAVTTGDVKSITFLWNGLKIYFGDYSSTTPVTYSVIIKDLDCN